MKKIVLLLLIFCFFSQSKSMSEFATHSSEMLKTCQEFIYQKFSQPIDLNWKATIAVGIGVWFIVDKTFPLIKHGFHKLWGTPPPKTVQELVNEGINKKFENELKVFLERIENQVNKQIEDFLIEKDKQIGIWKEKLSQEIYDNKVSPLSRRLDKFNDLMVDFKDAHETLNEYKITYNKMKEKLCIISKVINKLKKETFNLQFDSNNPFHSETSTPPPTPEFEIRSQSSEDLQQQENESDSDSSSSDEESENPESKSNRNSSSIYSIAE